MILDDLFNLAATAMSWMPPPGAIAVTAGVTTNQTGGLETRETNSVATETVTLAYVPRRVVTPFHPARPPEFSGAAAVAANVTIFPDTHDPNLTIIQAPNNYVINWHGTSFTANVDPATNIVFGAAGQQFVTISLCSFTTWPPAGR